MLRAAQDWLRRVLHPNPLAGASVVGLALSALYLPHVTAGVTQAWG
jgi:hypothetical protein